MKPCALSIAGFDPSSGAGVTADCLVMSSYDVHPLSVITALTVQNSQAVRAVDAVSAKQLAASLSFLLKDIPIQAVKTGLIANEEQIELILQKLPRQIPLVVDPILRSSSGFSFLRQKGIQALRKKLVPRATILTPNLSEAEILSGIKIHSMERRDSAAKTLLDLGAKAVLLKDGHGTGKWAVDRLYSQNERIEYRKLRIKKSVHGTGCALSAAITALLALRKNIPSAVQIAVQDTQQRIANAKKVGLGRDYLRVERI